MVESCDSSPVTYYSERETIFRISYQFHFCCLFSGHETGFRNSSQFQTLHKVRCVLAFCMFLSPPFYLGYCLLRFITHSICQKRIALRKTSKKSSMRVVQLVLLRSGALLRAGTTQQPRARSALTAAAAGSASSQTRGALRALRNGRSASMFPSSREFRRQLVTATFARLDAAPAASSPTVPVKAAAAAASANASASSSTASASPAGMGEI